MNQQHIRSTVQRLSEAAQKGDVPGMAIIVNGMDEDTLRHVMMALTMHIYGGKK